MDPEKTDRPPVPLERRDVNFDHHNVLAFPCTKFAAVLAVQKQSVQDFAVGFGPASGLSPVDGSSLALTSGEEDFSDAAGEDFGCPGEGVLWRRYLRR